MAAVVIGMVLGIVGGWCSFNASRRNNDLWFVGAFVCIIVLVIMGLSLAVAHWAAIGEIAEIDEMKRMITEAIPDASELEDVYGEAAKLNRKLASAKKYNALFWADPWIPDSYATQDPIALPIKCVK